MTDKKKSELNVNDLIKLIERSWQGIFVLNSQGRILYVNEQTCDLTGYTKEDLVNSSFEKLIHEKDYSILTECLSKQFSRKKISTCSNCEMINKDGSTFWVELYWQKSNWQQEPVKIIFFKRIDATEMIANEQLKIWGKNHVLKEATNDAVVLIDLQGTILDLNKKYTDLFHKSKQDMIGTNLWKYFPAHVSHIRKGKVAEVIKTGKIHELVDERKGVWNRTNLFPLFNEQNEVNKIAIFCRNITREKKIMNDLFNTEKLAVIGKITKDLAHKIRNPLGNISFAAQLGLRNKDLPEETREYLDLILQDVENANRVISNLLDFTEPRDVHPEFGDIKKVVEESLINIKPLCDNVNVDISVNYPKIIPVIKLDHKWLLQVLINILSKSIQAIQKEGRIAIELKQEDDYLLILIRVKGLAIDSAIMEKLYKLSVSNKTEQTDFESSVLHKIIQSHNGKIEVSKELDESTVIKLMLPLDKEREQSDDVASIN